MKRFKSFKVIHVVYCVKVAKALSLAVSTALLVNEIKAMSFGCMPLAKCFFKTLSIKVCVLPVPGGPKILTVFLYRFLCFCIPELVMMFFIHFCRIFIFRFNTLMTYKIWHINKPYIFFTLFIIGSFTS